MPNTASKWKLSGWLKMAAVTLVAFAGGMGGIYLGSIAFRGTPNIVEAQPIQNNASAFDYRDFIDLEVGDLFPLEDVIDTTGKVINIADLFDGQPAMVLFVSFDCEPCFNLLELWQKGIKERLYENAQVFVALKEPERRVPIEYQGLISGMHRISLDIEHWKNMYSIGEWPTAISVDASGFISKIQIGFVGFFEYGLLDELIVPSL